MVATAVKSATADTRDTRNTRKTHILMNIGKVKVPCGCEARKEIMYTHGNWDRKRIAIAVAFMVGIPVTVYISGRVLR